MSDFKPPELNIEYAQRGRYLYVSDESCDGRLTAALDEYGVMQVSDVFVDSPRRAGIGSSLVKAAVAEADKRSIELIVATVVSENGYFLFRSVFGEDSLFCNGGHAVTKGDKHFEGGIGRSALLFYETSNVSVGNPVVEFWRLLVQSKLSRQLD